LAIINNAVKNICEYILGWSGTAGSQGTSLFNFLKTLSKVVAPFYTTNNMRVPNSLHPGHLL
jgi:hypothetical protein